MTAQFFASHENPDTIVLWGDKWWPVEKEQYEVLLGSNKIEAELVKIRSRDGVWLVLHLPYQEKW
jgi:hypothetical protein